MAGTFVGQAWIQVSPSLTGFQRDISKQIAAPLQRAGSEAGKQLGQGVSKEMSPGLSTAAKNTESFGSRFKAAFSGILAAQVVQRVASAVWNFGKQSVEAYAAAEDRNIKFHDALRRIPGASDAVTKSLENQATALSKVTTYSAGQTKQATMTLAQYGLTGNQLHQLIPLVQDYAARTGQDLPSAASAVGKALLGQGRALKNVGINFKNTGSVAGNFAEITTGLQDKVGGMAREMGTTASGRMQIMKNQVAALQVSLGQALFPAIQRIIGVLIPLVSWIGKNTKWLIPMAGAILGVVGALKGWLAIQKLLDTELLTSPVGQIALAIGLMVIVFTTLYKVGGWLAVALGGVVIAVVALTIAFVAFDSVPIVAIIIAIIAAVVALVAGIIWLVQNWQTVWNAIVAAASWAWNTVIQPVFHALVAVWNTLAAAALWVWSTILQPVFQAIAAAWGAMVAAIRWFWNTILYPVIQAVWTIVSILFRIWIAPILLAIWLAWQAMTIAIRFFWNTVLHPVFNAVAAAASWVWNTILRPVFSAISIAFGAMVAAMKWVWDVILHPVFNALGAVFSFVWNSVLRPAFNAVKAAFSAVGGAISSVYHSVIVPVFDALKKAVGLVRQAFEGAKNGITTAWDKIRDAVKKPVKWVIDVIINKFIEGVNFIITKFKLPKIPTINTSKWAEGGQIPGPPGRPRYGGGDIVPALLEPGEFVLTKRQARAIGYRNLRNLPRYQTGGPVGRQLGGGFGAFMDPWAGIEMRSWTHWLNPLNVAKGVGHLAASGFGALADFGGDIFDEGAKLLRHGVAAAFEKGLVPLRKLIEKIPAGDSGWAQTIKKTVLWVMDQAVQWVRGHEEAEDAVSGIGVDALVKQIQARFPQLVVTSGYRPGSPDYHGKNLARDLGGPQHIMDVAADWIQKMFTPALLEGIHQAAGGRAALSVKNGRVVPPSFWGPATWAQHVNHIHLASEPSTAVTGDVREWIAKAINATGVDPKVWSTALAIQIRAESGGNPRAQNNWDSNAKRGTPSKGIMQVIDPTFRAYMLPGHGDIWNPVDNIIAAIRYIMGPAYRASKSSLGRWHPGPGYAEGGRVTGGRPGQDSVLAWLTPGEWVLTAKQSKALGYANLARLPRFQQGGPVTPGERAQLRINLNPPARPAPVVGPGDFAQGDQTGITDNRVVALLRRIAQGIEAGQTVVIDGREVARVVNREMAWVG